MVGESHFIGALTEAARSTSGPGALRQSTLAQIAGLLPFDSAIFLSPRLAEAPSSVNKDEFRKLYWNYARDPDHYRRGLAKGRRAAQALGGAYLDTEVFSAEERRNLPLYAEMIRPQGITSQIVAWPMFHGQSTGLLFLCRHGGGRFRDRDLARVLRVLPIIALAHAAVDAIAAASARATVDAVAGAPVQGGDTARGGRSALTAREVEIVEFVRRGLTNREIASVLGNRPNTVRNQLVSIFRKFEVASRAELAGLASDGRAT